MSTGLVAVVTAVAGVVALLGLASTLARRRIGLVHLVGAGALEVLVLAQAAGAVVALTGGHRPPETATFLGYLVSVVLLPVVGALWARSETTRWAGTVLAGAALVVAVMDWRLLQLWTATRG